MEPLWSFIEGFSGIADKRQQQDAVNYPKPQNPKALGKVFLTNPWMGPQGSGEAHFFTHGPQFKITKTPKT